MRITVNGEERAVAAGTALSAVVAEVAEGGHKVAVAVNGEVVARSRWPDVELGDGDRVEILAAIQGGR